VRVLDPATTPNGLPPFEVRTASKAGTALWAGCAGVWLEPRLVHVQRLTLNVEPEAGE
jgi:hypothetical protein